MRAEEKLKEIEELRNKLLRLGQPIVIHARELPQPEDAGSPPPRDITIVPYFE